MRKFFSFLLLCFLPLEVTLGQQTCSRRAQIDQNEVLVDISSNRKGEGLRPYFEKDPLAMSYYEEYRDRQDFQGISAVVMGVGIGMILTGIFLTPQKDSKIRLPLLVAGPSLMALNLIITSTYSYQNEIYLDRAVQEYNRRNTPKIFFSPFKNSNDQSRNSWGVSTGIQQEF